MLAWWDFITLRKTSFPWGIKWCNLESISSGLNRNYCVVRSIMNNTYISWFNGCHSILFKSRTLDEVVENVLSMDNVAFQGANHWITEGTLWWNLPQNDARFVVDGSRNVSVVEWFLSELLSCECVLCLPIFVDTLNDVGYDLLVVCGWGQMLLWKCFIGFLHFNLLVTLGKPASSLVNGMNDKIENVLTIFPVCNELKILLEVRMYLFRW